VAQIQASPAKPPGGMKVSLRIRFLHRVRQGGIRPPLSDVAAGHERRMLPHRASTIERSINP